MTWQFVNNPFYKGKMKILWGRGASPKSPYIVFAGLLNGVSAVDRKVDGVWSPGKLWDLLVSSIIYLSKTAT